MGYAYPNISFKETLVTPLPTTAQWRNRIGLAGKFRRGPVGAVRVTDKSTFNYLYGNDNSPGAIAARQLFALGVSDMVISRATPKPTPATATISFANSLPSKEAQIGYEGDVLQYRNGTPILTTGLKLEATYIGSALNNTKNSVGKFITKPASRLNNDFVLNGTSLFNYTCENRLTPTVPLTLTANLGAKSNAYTALAATTYTVGQTGITLALLNASLAAAPTYTLVPIVDGDSIVSSSGVKLTVVGTTVNVIVGGAVALGEVAFQVIKLAVTNCAVRLGAGSRVYQNNALVGYVLTDVNATSRALNIEIASFVTTPITSGSVVQCQAQIGVGTVNIKASTPTGYQYLSIDRTDLTNQALIGNITPGRLLYSKSSSVAFPGGYVTVYGTVLQDPTNENNLLVLVKGEVVATAAINAKVALMDPQVATYIFSYQYVNNNGDALTLKSDSTATYLQSQYLVQIRQVLVDGFILVPEAYTINAFTHDLLFKTSVGNLITVNSGVQFDLPQLASSGQIAFLAGSTYAVPVIRTSVAIGAAGSNLSSFDKGTSASEILLQLKRAILENSTFGTLFQEPSTTSTLLPASMYLTTNFDGTEANRIVLHLTRTTVGEDAINAVYSNDLLLNADNSTDSQVNWTTDIVTANGNPGSVVAFRDLYSVDSDPLVRVQALSDGAYGNSINFSVTLGTNGQFNLYVIDGDSSKYQTTPTSEAITLSTRDVDSTTGLFNASANSNLVRVYYLPVINSKAALTSQELDKLPLRIAPSFGDRIAILNSAPTGQTSSALPIYARAYQGASYLQGLYLQGGKDAPPSSDADASVLVDAVTALESVDVDIIMAAGVTAGDSRYTAVIQELLGQCNRAGTVNGLRRTVIQAPPGLSATQAQIFAASLNSSRATLVAGFATVQGFAGQNNVPVSAFYAACLALSPPEVSPASISEALPISGILAVDTPTTPTYLDTVTRAGCEALYYDGGLKSYKWLNGLTTSHDPFDKYVSIRRMADVILQDLYSNLIWIRSSKNTAETRSRCATAADNYLRTLARAERIQDFTASVCNSSNNNADTIAAGKVILTLFYTPIFPADFIEVSPYRQISNTISFQAQ